VYLTGFYSLLKIMSVIANSVEMMLYYKSMNVK